MPPTGSRARRLAKDLNDVHLLSQQCELFRQRTRADVELRPITTSATLRSGKMPPPAAPAAGRSTWPPSAPHRGHQRCRLPAHPRRPTRPHHARRNPPPSRTRLGQMRTFTEHAGALHGLGRPLIFLCPKRRPHLHHARPCGRQRIIVDCYLRISAVTVHDNKAAYFRRDPAETWPLPHLPHAVCRVSKAGERQVLNRDEFYVNLGCLRECAQVAGV